MAIHWLAFVLLMLVEASAEMSVSLINIARETAWTFQLVHNTPSTQLFHCRLETRQHTFEFPHCKNWRAWCLNFVQGPRKVFWRLASILNKQESLLYLWLKPGINTKEEYKQRQLTIRLSSGFWPPNYGVCIGVILEWISADFNEF